MTRKMTEEEKARKADERKKALLRERSKSGHQPGTRHMHDNAEYAVSPSGAWVRITPRRKHKNPGSLQEREEVICRMMRVK